MKKKSSLLTAIIAMLAIMVVVTACGGNNGNAPASTTAPANNPGNAEAPAEKPLDKVTFTYFNGAGAKKDVNTNETTIGKILEDQTGVNFYLEHLVGDLNTKIGTMIVSNEYPDVLTPDAAIDEVLAAGGFIDLEQLIEDHGPNIKKVYGQYFDILKRETGGIYYLPFGTQVGDFITDPKIGQGAFWVQRRVLEEAGYPKIKTVNEYFDLIRDYVAKHPEEGLTGFISLTHDWRFFATSNVPNHLAGYPNDGGVMVDMNTHEAKIYSNSQYYYDYFKMLNQLNADGLFDKSSFIDNYDQYLAKLTSGKVLGMFDYGWQIQNATLVLEDQARKDPSLDGYNYFPLPVTFEGVEKDQYLDPPAFVSNRGLGITVSAKDPVRIIQYFDNLLKEENQILRSWGIQGETYEIDENGRFYRTVEQIDKINEAFNESFGFKYYGWDWPMWGTSSTLSDGNALAPGLQAEVFQMSLTDADKKILDAYGAKTYAEMFADPDDRPWYPAWGIAKEQGSPEQIFETESDLIVKEWLPKLVLDPPSKYDANWNSYLAALNKLDIAGYEKFVTEKVKQLVELNK